MMLLPPSLSGVEKKTFAWLLPGVAVTAVGASGTVRGVTNTGGANVLPAKVETPTVQLYCTPLTMETTKSGDVPDANRVVWPVAAQFAP